MYLEGIYVYPLKSAAGTPLVSADVESRGISGDRRWMVVDSTGAFVTGRQCPRMALIRGSIEKDGIRLQAPGMVTEAMLTTEHTPLVEVSVWKTRVMAFPASRLANEWISDFLGFEARVVHMSDDIKRRVDPRYSQPGDVVSFADGYPLMLTNQASLEELSRRVSRDVSMRRFRPNLVVAGADPYAEDMWRRIRVGGLEFEVAKPCTRCAFVNVDPDSGVRDGSAEPLRTLSTYRRGELGVIFGCHLIPRALGQIRSGDSVEVIE